MDLPIGHLVVEVTRHQAFNQQLGASYPGRDTASLVTGAPLRRDFMPNAVRA
ncbi:hypothetical protein IFT68_04980 [Oxalobacteraceae sp. CFBP 13730]|nr:hypothetical protein [Oxalobacteraceae sp. CFBP 13730]